MINVKEVIIKECQSQGVDETLALAIATIESHFDSIAFRFELKFPYSMSVDQFAKISRVSQDTEKMLQACSFGAMQIMGLTAREAGFKGPLLDLLFMPDKPIHYAVKHLKKLCSRYESEDHIIAAYNAGSPRRKGNEFVNQGYVDKVKVELKKIRSISL
jgi:hypothetical protein